LQQLKELDLHGNQLRGDIAVLLSELRNVEYVDLSYNRFYGGISISLENISSLANTVHHFNLSHNKLNGGFFKRESIELFRNLEVLDFGDNQISGELSPSLGSLPNLRVLRLGSNQLFGLIPEELLESSVLEELDLSGNGFTGKELHLVELPIA
jgi:Leucine-rich repeat (LRR) protein